MATCANTRLICSLTAGDPAAMRAAMAMAADRGADAVELRLDHLDPPPTPEQLRALLTDAPLEVIVTCRPRGQGGRFDGPEGQRLDLLRQAAAMGADWIDVERSVPPRDRPAGNVILSHHDFQRRPADLAAVVASLEASEAAVSKVAFAAAGPEDALAALDGLRASPKPAISLAMGEAGVASRILARKLGAFGTFAALESGAESAPGQPTLAEFRDLYRWEHLAADTAVFGVIGCPVGHSMSPAIHNAAFSATGVNGVYVPLRIEPGAENFNRFLDGVLERPWLDWRGLSVTIPHKENALAYVGADRCDPLAVRIGAVNTITIEPDGSLRGDNTDYAAAIDALCDAMGIAREDLADRRVAVLGAGGAARAIVAALDHYGAAVTIYNRTLSRAERLAEEFGATPRPIADAADAPEEILINCTPLGMHPKVGASPLPSLPEQAKVVFDTIYNPLQTRLLQQGRSAGLATVSGLEMFVNQAVAQFETWTGHPAPRGAMRAVVISRLEAKVR